VEAVNATIRWQPTFVRMATGDIVNDSGNFSRCAYAVKKP
jgi:hypothetical protein